jgi:hypothetical protein
MVARLAGSVSCAPTRLEASGVVRSITTLFGFRAELPPTDVIGIRYTIECDGTGRWGCPKKAVADTSG